MPGAQRPIIQALSAGTVQSFGRMIRRMLSARFAAMLATPKSKDIGEEMRFDHDRRRPHITGKKADCQIEIRNLDEKGMAKCLIKENIARLFDKTLFATDFKNRGRRRRSNFMIRIWFSCVAILLSMEAAAQWNPYNPIIAGVPVHCTSFNGQPVAFVLNPALPDVGRAMPGMPPTIELNPYYLTKLTPKMQLFWYGHECAHHVLGPANSESNADCWSIKKMRNQGLLAPNEVSQLQAQIANSSGSMWGHLPGPQRAQLFAQCYQSP